MEAAQAVADAIERDALPHLCDAETWERIRPATEDEIAAAELADDDGRFPVDWRAEGGWQGEDFRLCYIA